VTTRLAARGILACVAAAAFALALTAVLVISDAPDAVWWLIAALAILAAALIGLLALHRPGATLAEVTRAASLLAEGELGQRVETTTGPTAALTHSFNSMAGRLQDLVLATEAEQARLEAVFEASADAMVALSRDTSVRFLNAAAERLLQTRRETAIGRPFIESARDYELDALVRRAVAMPASGDTAVITFGPRRLPLRAAALPITDGGNWSVLLILTDLTDIQRLDQVRRDFLSNVSHELRTPLASVRAMVETVENGDIDDSTDLAEFMRRIRQQVHRMTLLVNELLDLSRIESGAIDLRPEPLDIAELAAEAASLLQVRTQDAKVTVLPPPTPGPTIEADRASLLRIISNLLENAIKYSPPGSTIRTEVLDEGELVALIVADDGPGIEVQDLPRVFERFYKGDPSRAHATSGSGTGLGLAIVKHLVRAHGGTAEAASPPGSGAIFTVRLPRHFVGTRRETTSRP
jgi:two-component system, OmpR family, phosphate regulon sensor histidine kinase PhoR